MLFCRRGPPASARYPSIDPLVDHARGGAVFDHERDHHRGRSLAGRDSLDFRRVRLHSKTLRYRGCPAGYWAAVCDAVLSAPEYHCASWLAVHSHRKRRLLHPRGFRATGVWHPRLSLACSTLSRVAFRKGRGNRLMPQVIVAGDLFADLILSGFDCWPEPGREVYAEHFHREIGGGAAISACGLAKLGTPCGELGVVGCDTGEAA